jgi:hypothetical protein
VVVEIITNQTASDLELLAKDPNVCRYVSKPLALDCLLGWGQRGVCGKFNYLDRCLQIDNNGQAVTNITTNIRKIAYVLVQTWDGWKQQMALWLVLKAFPPPGTHCCYQSCPVLWSMPP